MRKIILVRFLLVFLTAFAADASAQTPTFTYQGKLTDASAAANGQYDFTFRLFDASSEGTQIGTDVFLDNVAVTAGIFTVNLDFGANAFSSGTARFLEISVRTGASTGAFTTLAPRQQITSSPYSIKSLNAANADNATNAANADTLDSLDSSAFVQTNTTDFIRNQTTQQAANFNINGTGKANVFDATTQYNIGGNRILSNAGTNNLFAGVSAGAANSGTNNSFFGANAGKSNTTGFGNSFVGSEAGKSTITGGKNSFFGFNAGYLNTNGGNNSFFGWVAGYSNESGGNNSFFGLGAGYSNISGGNNSFFGINAGYKNATGFLNSFLGSYAGFNNTTGNNNTMIGTYTDVGAGDLTFATAIGAGAVVNSSNTIVLGRTNGSDKVVIYGLGAAGSTDLCRNASNEISNCSSSLRYKTGVENFTAGLNIVRRLRPISFNWIDGSSADVGFAAEEVYKIEPLLTTTKSSGEIEGVKYGQMTTVLVNAVKEQQAQIEAQQEQIDALKKLVCELKPEAAICKEEQK